jgi:oligopeptide/dipeptide ABC transporter ATP-binding protein
MDLQDQPLSAIGGRVPPLDAMPSGCRFAARCPLARSGCELPQQLLPAEPNHLARCHVTTGALQAA